LVDLLRVTILIAVKESLVRVKSHFPEVDMVKVGEGPDTTKDLHVVEEEVRVAANKIMDTIDYKGDDGEE
jgi:hypothetical protein